MKIFYHLYIFIVILLGIAACTPSASPKLQEADEELTYAFPKGKLLLDSLESHNNKLHEFDQKYLQVLRIKTDDKEYIPLRFKKKEIDSLVIYFEEAGNDAILAKAYYYAGRVYFEIGDTPHALSLYQKALQCVDSHDFPLQGDIHCQIAYIYNMCDLNDDAILSLRQALTADSLSGNGRNMLYDFRDLGENYYEKREYEKAKTYAYRGIQKAASIKDSLLTGHLYALLANSYRMMGKQTLAMQAFKECLKYDFDKDKNGLYCTGIDLLTDNHEEVPQEYITWLTDSGNVLSKRFISRYLTQQAIERKDFSAASKHFQKFIVYSDSANQEKKAYGVKQVEKLYNYKIKEQENIQLKKENKIEKAITILCGLLLVLSCLLIYFIRKGNKQRERILKLKLDKYKQAIASRKLLSDMSEQDSEKSLSPLMASNIYAILQKQIEEKTYRLSPQEWKDLEHTLNGIYPNLVSSLNDLCSISEQEIRICLLIKCNIRPIDIASFVNRSKEAISSNRRRLYKKAFGKDGGAQDWDNIIRAL